MKRKAIIFGQLQNFKKSKYPEFIKTILIETAFDTAAALRTIKKSSIEEIEKFVEQKTDILKGTSYVDETGNLKEKPFNFLIGHESLILRLPTDVEEYLARKEAEKPELPSFEDSKELLKQKITNLARKNKITLTVNSEDMTNFTRKNNSIRCQAKCQLCPVKIACFYYSSWKISNYRDHFVSCLRKKATEFVSNLDENLESLKNQGSGPSSVSSTDHNSDLGSDPTQIRRATPNVVLKEIQNVIP